jgi:hypothetical protein
MRLWTLHPEYLDPQGLVALWRETLLAQKVLRGETKGYRHHPQLTRFRASPDPLAALGFYLRHIANEASRRGYAFDESKILETGNCDRVEETEGQLLYEWQHLKQKLAVRSPSRLQGFEGVSNPSPHPLFRIVPGDVREWERR